MPGFPVKMSETPATMRIGAPLLGEHTVKILKDMLDYSDEKIEVHSCSILLLFRHDNKVLPIYINLDWLNKTIAKQGGKAKTPLSPNLPKHF